MFKSGKAIRFAGSFYGSFVKMLTDTLEVQMKFKYTIVSFQVSRCSRDCCYKYMKRRLPILSWARNYKLTWLPQDALAGFTVGLTAIPQGIAYAIVADLSPEVN